MVSDPAKSRMTSQIVSLGELDVKAWLEELKKQRSRDRVIEACLEEAARTAYGMCWSLSLMSVPSFPTQKRAVAIPPSPQVPRPGWTVKHRADMSVWV